MNGVPEPRVRILGLSGSLRRNSYNTLLLACAARFLPARAEYVRFEHLKAIPPFDEDDEAGPGAGATTWRRAIEWADALVVVTPEYNSSIPGQLKNAIDWASRPTDRPAIRGKDVAVIGASTGMFGAVWAQAEARKALGAAGARVIDRELAVGGAHAQFDSDGRLDDRALSAELAEIMSLLVAEASTSVTARLPASLVAD